MVFQKLLARFLVSALTWTFVLRRFLDQKWSISVLCITSSGLFFLHIAAAVLYVAFVYPRFSSLRDLPTAPQAPLRHRFFKEPCAYHFERWINEVPNEGLIRYFGVLNMERVLLTSSAAVQQVLQGKAYSFEKQYAQKTHLERVSGKGLVFQEGAVHKFQRKVLNRAFRRNLVKKLFYPLIWTKTADMLNLIQVEARSLRQVKTEHCEGLYTSGILNANDIVSRSIFDITGLVSYGIDFESITRPEKLFRPLKNYREAFEPSPPNRQRMYLAFLLPAWAVNALPIRFNRTTGIGVSRFRGIGKDFIARRKLERRVEGIESRQAFPAIMETIMAAEKLSDLELLEQFSMLQAGGIHTTVAAILSTIWYLAQPRYFDIQRQLREEVRRELCSPGSYAVSSEAFEQCTYLKAVINEVLRLHTPFSWFGRTPTHQSEICSKLLPAGLSISLSPWAMHRCRSLWGEEASDFKPDRWLQAGAQCSIPKDNFQWLTFGAGPRRCIGEQVARAELECILAGLFGRYEIRFKDEQHLPRVTHQVTLALKEELKVRITRIGGW